MSNQVDRPGTRLAIDVVGGAVGYNLSERHTKPYTHWLLQYFELIDSRLSVQNTMNVMDYAIAYRAGQGIPLELGEYREEA